MPALLVILVASVSAAVVAAQSPAAPRDVTGWMARVAERIEQYYARAHSIICEEIVRLEPLGHDLLPNGEHVRQLVYELRIAWDGASDDSGDAAKPPTATVLRQLMTVDGRPPRPGDEPECMDPKPVSPEPLAMLLPTGQPDYRFTWKGQGRESGRASVSFEYRASGKPGPIEVVRTGDCSQISLPGRSRGRVWLDAATADVLRLDEELTGQFAVPIPALPGRRGGASLFTIERASSSISYRHVKFNDPDETLILPSSVVSLQVIRDSGKPRLRMTQKFSKYRRFMTGAKIVEDTALK